MAIMRTKRRNRKAALAVLLRFAEDKMSASDLCEIVLLVADGLGIDTSRAEYRRFGSSEIDVGAVADAIIAAVIQQETTN